MIEYQLKDANGASLSLNGAGVAQPTAGSMTASDDAFEFDRTVVERSAMDGAVALGKNRIKSRELTLKFARSDADASAFRADENELLEFLGRATLLVDVTNGLQVEVSVLTYKVSYEDGSLKLSSDNELTLKMLRPFWEATTATHHEESDPLTVGSNAIPLVNDGSLPAPPLIVVTALGALAQLQVYVDETKEGIEIDDPLFGTVGFEELTIDCAAGQVTLAGFDRSQNILPGTGFFELPAGALNLKVVVDEQCTLTIDFRERSHV